MAPTAESTVPKDHIVEFLRRRDYIFVKELGRGGCGRTVLLRDTQIDETLVCKKYAPVLEAHRTVLFANFVREIKLLYKLNHPNVVRVFNYYLYPELFAGYILMEFIGGVEIDKFLAEHPERINEVFQQSIDGFSYLQASGILHRDIRPANLMVRDDGILKIIDLGFGKEIRRSEDFDKSVSLNWWCELPNEFATGRYDFCTEVYFVGKLFERVIRDNGIGCFEYMDALRCMCSVDPASRVRGFEDLARQISSRQFFEIEFSDDDRDAYRAFADALCHHISKIQNGAQYVRDVAGVQGRLEDVYRTFMLEKTVPDAALVLRCFLDGNYYYIAKGLPVHCIKAFLQLIKASSEERKKIIFANTAVQDGTDL
jgi:serine/threonine-protein kinase